MKRLTLIPVLFAFTSLTVVAQYTGGIGRGDIQVSLLPLSLGLAETPFSKAGRIHAWPVPASTVLHFDHAVTGTVHDLQGNLVGQLVRSQAYHVQDLASGGYVLMSHTGSVLLFLKD